MNFIPNLFRNLPWRGKLLVITLFLSLTSILIALRTGGLPAALIVSGSSIAILTVAKDVWGSEYDSKTEVRLASLGIIYLLAIGQPKWKSFINPVLEPLLEPLLKILPLPEGILRDTPSLAVLVVGEIGILFINLFIRDTTVLRTHPTPLKDEFPEKRYTERFKSFCKYIREDLDKIDGEAHWSAEYFTPLDAEVEIQANSQNRTLRRVGDLLTAIRKTRKSRVFLVLGDPGSGKSVALRKLCRELLEESEQTGKVPIYINLREWKPKTEWDESNPPSTKELIDDLYQFVFGNLEGKGTLFVSDFIKKYSRKMYDNGRFFFILDSFDEISIVLDTKERSWIIDKLSDTLYSFLVNDYNKEPRGVLASRIFRRPTEKFKAETVLEIRPFTEKKIRETLTRGLLEDSNIVNLIFTERQEFVPVARNPFTAELILEYSERNNYSLPENQTILYSSYIDQRLNDCIDKIQNEGLTCNIVKTCAIDIANMMLSTQRFGLEVPVEYLKKNLPQYSIEKIISILKFAKLGRIGGGVENQFSFVHRRFNEFFVVEQLQKEPDRVPKEAIPTDSRWRDALVLYCEVAEEHKAREIANFCWQEIQEVISNNVEMSSPQFIKMIHCLRFLKEAFRARVNCISAFRSDLALFIQEQLGLNKDLLLQKFAVEAVGLLSNEDIDRAIVKAINLENDWISETAIKSCRHLPRISSSLKDKLIAYIDKLTPIHFISIKDELSFSLSLSNGFSEVGKFLFWRFLDIRMYLLGGFLCLLSYPKITIISLVFVFSMLKIYSVVFSSDFFEKMHPMIKRHIYNLPFYLIIVGQVMSLISAHGNLSHYHHSLLTSILFIPRSSLLIEVIIISCIFICILPFYQFFYYRYVFRSRQFINLVLFDSFICLIEIIIVRISDYISSISTFIVAVFTVSFTLITISFLGFFMYKLFIEFLDYLTYIRLIKNKNYSSLTREKIANYFSTLKTSSCRKRYVDFLQVYGVKPTGMWPNGKLPNINNDKASTLLARLEERWLGLDR